MTTGLATLVFDEAVQRSDVESALRAKGYQLMEESEASDEDPWIQVWRRDEVDITQCAEDAVFGFRYVATPGDAAKDVLQTAVAGLPTMTLDDALQHLTAAPDVSGMCRSLGVVAACARPPSTRVFVAIGSCLPHANRTILLAAIIAAIRTGWPGSRGRSKRSHGSTPTPRWRSKRGSAATYVRGDGHQD